MRAGVGRVFRFGAFEFDSSSSELRKDGIRLRVPDQSLAILALLLDRPGEMIARDEIRERLWPNGTIVEFEHSVNSAVKRLRQALLDDAATPRFIETLPKRGYRFISEVETAGPPAVPAHYRILGEAGHGAMGIVYRAEDLRLGRIVALKFIPEQLAADSRALERLRREARTMAALSHPGVCTVHELSEHDGRPCLVMEFVEGRPLDRLLDRGPLKTEQASDIGIQAAEALAAAHAAGIVHRDVKPSNILVTNGGQVKLTDFGIAHRSGEATATQAGTSAYMSPEQACGEQPDSRSDVFSLGAVLYEMFTGHPHSTGVPPSQINPQIPLETEFVILRALAKDRSQRWQSAAELVQALRAAASAGERHRPPARSRAARVRLWTVRLGLAMCLAVAVAASRAWIADPGAAASELRYTPVPSGGQGIWAVWSPDGGRIAYTHEKGLALQAPDSYAPSVLTEGITLHPFFSADGSRVYYFRPTASSSRSLWSVSVAGGAPEVAFADLGGFSHLDGGAASPDGKALAVVSVDEGRNQASLAVSSPPGAPLRKCPAQIFPNANLSRAPLRFSPDGSKLLAAFARRAPHASLEWWLLEWPPPPSPGPKTAQRLFADGPSANLVSGVDWLGDSRHLIVALVEQGSVGGRLWLADTVTGRWRQLTRDPVAYNNPRVSRSGRVLVEVVDENEHIVTIQLDSGQVRSPSQSRRRRRYPCFSPVADQMIFVTDERGETEIWLTSLREGWYRPVVTQKDLPAAQRGSVFVSPVFSPSGSSIAYCAAGYVWVSPLTGGPAVRIGEGSAPTWSPDGASLAFAQRPPAWALVKVRLVEPQKLEYIYRSTSVIPPRWSPDGRWLTARFPEGFGVVSPDGTRKKILFKGEVDWGMASGWSQDGSTLFLGYVDHGERVVSAFNVNTGSERRVAKLGETSFSYLWFYSTLLSQSRDGKTLVASVSSEGHEPWILDGVTAPPSFWGRLFRW